MNQIGNKVVLIGGNDTDTTATVNLYSDTVDYSAAIATGCVMVTLGSTSGRATDTPTLETTPSIVNDTEFDVAAVTVCPAFSILDSDKELFPSAASPRASVTQPNTAQTNFNYFVTFAVCEPCFLNTRVGENSPSL